MAAPVTGTNAASCISLAIVGGRRVIAPDTLLFEAVGPNDYRNRLTGLCPATERLGSSATIVLLDGQGSQICAGDRVRIVDPAEERVASASTCQLGRFEPVVR
ncbi:hypothetical protein [Sphingomonas sp. LHG3406-1]|uniref:hypothetical protein n=1 Tax=Sphingomonas sp. LHG3406-1 TaxID=2804617 RepID=UPI00260441F3|nr:hypothetical protein [Sphingomonas sp. LHG3406-1]